ncbi:trypsin-like serine protease [uncultured Polaribacter sp.]|uniref:trypsin-like serine protease n=1 Tax=uncultured Polaribacter sp. TaxID=174711 RepID=UPI00261219C2|nr:trypsin-like serine protease [uncultured Polaribacter sp.]
MNLKKYSILSIICLLNFSFGVYREDVSIEKHIELASDKEFDCVGKILNEGGILIGSGVLINENWVITAGHVVEDVLNSKLRFKSNNIIYDSEKVILYPDYKSNVLGHNGDVALIKIKASKKQIEPATSFNGNEIVGKQIIYVGYGTSGKGKQAIKKPTPAGRKLAGTNIIDATGQESIDDRELPDQFLIADFDHPTHKELNRIGSATPTDLEYFPMGGDSGGGAFVKVGNKFYLVGIHSGATAKINDDINLGLHGSLIYTTNLSFYKDWISETIKI